MNLSEQGFEVLQTIGYPIYARRTLIEHNRKLIEAESRQSVQRPKSSPEKVRERAQSVSANARARHPDPKPVELTWPVYNLSMLGVSGHLLAVFSVSRETADQGKMLIARMLHRCGIPSAIDYGQEFRWPLFPHKPVDQSQAVATKALAGLLHKALAQYRWQRILVFGEDAAGCTFGQSYHQLLGKQSDYLGLPTVVSISVEEMLLDPQLRKLAWQHLLPVRESYSG